MPKSDKIYDTLCDCADTIEGLWHQNEDEPFEPEEITNKKVAIKYRATLLYRKKLKDVAGDILDFCADLILDNEKMSVAEYGYVVREFESFMGQTKQLTFWYLALRLIFNHFDDVKVYERERVEDNEKFEKRREKISAVEKAIAKKSAGNINIANYISKDAYKDCGTFKDYLYIYEEFPFQLCWRLCNYPEERKEIKFDEIDLFATPVKIVCLFTALKNEGNQLREYAYVHGVVLPDEPEELQIEAPKPQAKRTRPVGKKTKPTKATKQEEEDNTTLAEKKADKVWKQKVFTSRANKYFAKAIEVGYMQETETGYQWTYSNELQPIAYFFIRIYDKGRPQYKMLRQLFSITSRLNNVATELRKAGWYSDDSKRDKLIAQGKDPEKDASHKLKDPPEWYIELKKFFNEQ